jgi:hypothetical protein
MTPEVAQFSNKGMNQDISVSKATNEFAFENYNIRITAVNDNTLLSVTNEKLPNNLPIQIQYNKIPNKITYKYYPNLCFVSKAPVESDIIIEYTIGNNIETTAKEIIIHEGNTESSVVLIPDGKSLKQYIVKSPITDKRFHYYTDYSDSNPSEILDYIEGTYLGHAILNNNIVLFTKKELGEFPDLIYVLNIEENILKGEIKYEGDLNFQLDKPIETLPYYESELVQKVYWVDGYNQPRVINIVADDIVERLDTQFDFNPTITKFPEVTITKEYSGVGLFPAGVIQYFVSYYNKYGAETGIVWSSDLQYVTEYNRAAGPDETVVCNFKIDISNVDTTYDYARVYSMQRTSLNTTPICRIVGDININNSDSITIIDTNTNTETIDPTQLLFLGGDNFIASTLTQKDDVLFLGDLTIDTIEVPQEIKDLFAIPEGKTKLDYLRSETVSTNNNTYKSFKKDEWYRVGIQFQDNTTKWTAPIFIGDIQVDIYSLAKDSVPIITFDIYHMFQYNEDAKNLLSRYSNYRLLMVETNPSNRSILAQGFISPTVFNLEQRVNKTGPYAIGSWINRPRKGNANWEHLSSLGYDVVDGKIKNLPTTEIQNSINRFPLLENTEKDYILSFNVTSGNNWIDLAIYESDFDESLNTDNYTEYDPSNIKGKVDYESIASINGFMNSKDTYDAIIKWFISRGIAKDKITLSYESYKNYIDSTYYSNGDQTYFREITPIQNASLWCAGIVNSSISGYTITPNISGSIIKAGAYTIVNTEIPKEINLKEYINSWYVDASILTFNSPDIENNESLFDEVKNLNFRIIGLAPISTVNSDITITTKTDSYKNGGGLVKSLWKNNKKQLLNAPIYQDYAWEENGKLDTLTTYDYYLYLWNKKGSITGQTADSYKLNSKQEKEYFNTIYADLEHKVIANKSFSEYIDYFDTTVVEDNTYTNIIPTVFNSNIIETKYINTINGKQTYQGNYDFVAAINSNSKYEVFYKNSLLNIEGSIKNQSDPVLIKFNKTPHVVFELSDNNSPFILPYIGTDDGGEDAWSIYSLYGKQKENTTTYPWYENNTQYSQKHINLLRVQPALFIGEFYRDVDSKILYGEPTQNNLEKHVWIPISKALSIEAHLQNPMSYSTQGDTYYQRWECLNTIPSTEEDLNSVVDIVSFMVETHVNLEGRYDKNKDSLNILNARPDNFNKINPVYSQTNNYFTYNILDEKFNQNRYFNQVAFSLQKTPTSEIDTWCNISLASAFNLDGKYGKLNKLITVNDAIIAFQDKALSVINFNNRTAISTENGVPIEIANSGKVNGYSIISSNIGCQNKLSICEASSGVYFIDDLNKTMYGFNKEGLSNISSKGMSMWFKKNLTGKEKCFYDKLTNDVYVTNNTDCLVYNEALDAFTSFMDYNNINSLFNFEGKSFILGGNYTVNVMQMFGGEYTNNYYIQYKINPEPLTDKTFTNIEFIADKLNNDSIDSIASKKNLLYPFTEFEVWNEYQYGITNLTKGRMYPNFERKFRIWRADIPRDESNGRDRIRNPWIYLKLNNKDNNNAKMVFHSFLVKYYK